MMVTREIKSNVKKCKKFANKQFPYEFKEYIYL